MLERQKPVIWADREDSSLSGYKEQGFSIKKDCLRKEDIEIARDKAFGLGKMYNGEQAAYESNGQLRLIMGVHFLKPSFVNLLITPRIIAVAEAILGRGVYIHQFRLHFKPAFWGGDFFWHSDYTIWHWLDGMIAPRCLTFVIPLEPMREENGPVMVSPGTHIFHASPDFSAEDQKEISIRQERDNQDRLRRGYVSDEQLDLVRKHGAKNIILNQGEIFYFDVNLLHASGTNLSPYGRLCAFISLNSIENKLQDPLCGKPPRAEWIASRDYNRL